MPNLSETSDIVLVSSLASDVEKTTYQTLIASTVRRSTWFVSHFGQQNGGSGDPLARYDIAIGAVNEEVDLIPDLGGAYAGGTSNAGTGHITTSFPFVIAQGVRVSGRVRSPVNNVQNFDLAIRLIQ